MTPERIAELRRLAEAATQGPWSSQHCRVWEYLNAANPATILELLAEIERLRTENDWLRVELTRKDQDDAMRRNYP